MIHFVVITLKRGKQLPEKLLHPLFVALRQFENIVDVVYKVLADVYVFYLVHHMIHFIYQLHLHLYLFYEQRAGFFNVAHLICHLLLHFFQLFRQIFFRGEELVVFGDEFGD